MKEKDDVIRQFNETSDGYLTSNVHAKGKDLAWIKEVVRKGERRKALDVATGAGHTAITLSELVYEVVAVDITPNMLKLAESHAKTKGIHNISFAIGDVENLSFPDDSFDIVTCRIAAHHFPELRRAVAEMHRVLTKKGKLIIVDNYIPEDSGTNNRINEIEKLRDPSHNECISLKKWEELFQSVGFTNIVCYKKWTSTMDLDSWIKRAKPSKVNSEQIYQIIKNENLNWIDKDEVHLRKVMWVCTK
ncbi:class I SAM-dependent methyltransferase [Alkalihalobacterium elongatum]|uniref:class I SAM-dependent methyltransferase n=1 Tax=Alkalihalobacterium elongatum TaxID=2675466 RepID=UPI001C1FC791|nr:methyltransferase domain-containing protein [Alkalihalobacterium elongatum]